MLKSNSNLRAQTPLGRSVISLCDSYTASRLDKTSALAKVSLAEPLSKFIYFRVSLQINQRCPVELGVIQ